MIGVEHESALDEYYDLSLSTDDHGVQVLLNESHFMAPLKGGFVQYPEVAAGPQLEESPLVTTTKDRSRAPDGRPTARHARVDKRDPSKVYVHIKVATTP